jgi:hypothetical protein
MAAPRHPLHDRTVARAKRGDFASVREMMLVASIPRQTAHRWLREAGIDVVKARLHFMAKLRADAERYLAGLPPRQKPSRALLRRVGAQAKSEWDRGYGSEGHAISDQAAGAVSAVPSSRRGARVS